MELSAFAHLTRRNVKVIQPGLVYVIEWAAGEGTSPTTSAPPGLSHSSSSSSLSSLSSLAPSAGASPVPGSAPAPSSSLSLAASGSAARAGECVGERVRIRVGLAQARRGGEWGSGGGDVRGAVPDPLTAAAGSRFVFLVLHPLVLNSPLLFIHPSFVFFVTYHLPLSSILHPLVLHPLVILPSLRTFSISSTHISVFHPTFCTPSVPPSTTSPPPPPTSVFPFLSPPHLHLLLHPRSSVFTRPSSTPPLPPLTRRHTSPFVHISLLPLLPHFIPNISLFHHHTFIFHPWSTALPSLFSVLSFCLPTYTPTFFIPISLILHSPLPSTYVPPAFVSRPAYPPIPHLRGRCHAPTSSSLPCPSPAFTPSIFFVFVSVAYAFLLSSSYHDWEHFSSIRNLKGPHTGLPAVRETPPYPYPSSPTSSEHADPGPRQSKADAKERKRMEAEAKERNRAEREAQRRRSAPGARRAGAGRRVRGCSRARSGALTRAAGLVCPFWSRALEGGRRCADAEEGDGDGGAEERTSRSSGTSTSLSLSLSPPALSSSSSLSSLSSVSPSPPPEPVPPVKPLTRRERKKLGLPKTRATAVAAASSGTAAKGGAGKIVIPGGRFEGTGEWRQNGNGRLDVRGFRELKI
ncbi:hypothetical protein B0H14DRAFT_3782518 [Mycena olivaceomarginata]|nr:hypothetical protein B0H14DRAFT_3782518 [Mycena olivaceomarginata]